VAGRLKFQINILSETLAKNQIGKPEILLTALPTPSTPDG